MGALHPRADAERVMHVLDQGGVAIVPLDVAYAVFGGSGQAIRQIFAAKGRSFSKPNGMMADFELFSEVHVVGERERDMVRAVTDDYGLPLSVVAPFRADHPIFRDADPFTMERSTKLGTLDLLLNAGPLHREVARLSRERLKPVLGSSANRSMTGSKYRLQDVDPEVRQIAGIEIDYGLSRYANPSGVSSTIIDLKTFEVRHGVCFDQISDILDRHFGVRVAGPSRSRRRVRSDMALFDVEADARRAFEAVSSGGIAIVPNDIGYSALGCSREALGRIFETKQRGAQKLNAMVANLAIHHELHACSSRGREIVQAITGDYDLPLGCIAPFRPDHPMMAGLDAEVLSGSTRDGTLVMLLNAGRFHAALTALSHASHVPLFGSSANLTMSGTKLRVEDIEPAIKAIATVTIDHGLQRFHPYGSSSTLLNVETLDVVRFGSCYEDISYILKRHFGADLPPRPAK